MWRRLSRWRHSSADREAFSIVQSGILQPCRMGTSGLQTLTSTLRPRAGQIKRAEYIYLGSRRAGVHRDAKGKPVVKIVSSML